ncbi:MAG: ATP-binding protein [bacterium]|nr:ATP-binding protein [bacterium]
MATISRNHKFGSTVQLGIFTIVILLLFLNVSANYIIYHIWEMHKTQISLAMNHLAVEISREVQMLDEPVLGETMSSQICQSFELSGLAILPSVPETDDPSIRWRWYLTATKHLNVSELNRITPTVLYAKSTELIPGEGDVYSLTYIFPAGNEKHLLVLYKEFPTLSYLDTTSRRMIIFNLAALAIIMILSLLLRRYIMAPFRKMRQAAEEAGRAQAADADEVELVVEEYRNMIGELREKETRLVEMNRVISSRADRLEQFNAHILASMNSGLISVDHKGIVNSINMAAADILAESVDGLIGKPILSGAGSTNEVISAISLAYQERKSKNYTELDLTLPNGDIRKIGITISLIQDEKGSFLGITAVIADLTELFQLRKSLERNDRLSALGEMSGGLAHQLRNTLGAILGYSRLVRKRLVANDLSSEYVEAIEQEGTEAENMIEKFLSFSRPFEFQPAEENLAELLEDVRASEGARVRSNHIGISLVVPDDLQVICDRLLIKQALCNIVDNAIGAYHGLAGEIRIAAAAEAETIQILIEDSAGGIPESIQHRIFTPFVSSRPGGTGLGLSLAARIVDLHEGNLRLKKSTPQGTVFELSLPAPVSKNGHQKSESITARN